MPLYIDKDFSFLVPTNPLCSCIFQLNNLEFYTKKYLKVTQCTIMDQAETNYCLYFLLSSRSWSFFAQVFYCVSLYVTCSVKSFFVIAIESNFALHDVSLERYYEIYLAL